MSDDNKNLPDYLTEGEGKITVTLRSGVDIAGTKVLALTMREPTVNDHLIYESTKGNEAHKEMTYIANLCDIAQEDVKRLTMHDYGRVQKAFAVFLA